MSHFATSFEVAKAEVLGYRVAAPQSEPTPEPPLRPRSQPWEREPNDVAIELLSHLLAYFESGVPLALGREACSMLGAHSYICRWAASVTPAEYRAAIDLLRDPLRSPSVGMVFHRLERRDFRAR